MRSVRRSRTGSSGPRDDRRRLKCFSDTRESDIHVRVGDGTDSGGTRTVGRGDLSRIGFIDDWSKWQNLPAVDAKRNADKWGYFVEEFR